MKRLIGAVLGLALTVPLAPAAVAQSLDFGSLGSSNAETTDPVPETYPYTVFERGHYSPLGDGHRCSVGIGLNLMVETSGPGATHGYLGAVDNKTGLKITNESDTRFTSDVFVFDYLDPAKADWRGTTRNFTMFNVDFKTGEEQTLGTVVVSIPAACSAGEGRVELDSGYLTP